MTTLFMDWDKATISFDPQNALPGRIDRSTDSR